MAQTRITSTTSAVAIEKTLMDETEPSGSNVRLIGFGK
jgi:hypothetical protein